MEKRRILIIDHDDQTKKVARLIFNKDHYRIFTAAEELEALSLIKRRLPHLIIVNLHLAGSHGMSLLKKVKALLKDEPVVVLGERVSDQSPNTAAELGVAACATKPLDAGSFSSLIDEVERQFRPFQHSPMASEFALRPIVGESEKVQQILRVVKKVANSSATVLVQGPSGTGKELIARAIHYFSPRRDKPFITVNCAALPEGLLESELFGVRQGAFTGATANRDGKIQLAHQGTLVLDEIGDLNFSLQAKLLRVLQEKEVTPLGGTTPKKVNIRVIAITNQDLAQRVKEGKFREDLFYRLNVIPIYPPRLSERKEDIPRLINHFITLYNKENGRRIQGVSSDVLQSLLDYNWPGNIRELENTIEKAVVLAEGDSLQVADLPDHIPIQSTDDVDRELDTLDPWGKLVRAN